MPFDEDWLRLPGRPRSGGHHRRAERPTPPPVTQHHREVTRPPAVAPRPRSHREVVPRPAPVSHPTSRPTATTTAKASTGIPWFVLLLGASLLSLPFWAFEGRPPGASESAKEASGSVAGSEPVLDEDFESQIERFVHSQLSVLEEE